MATPANRPPPTIAPPLARPAVAHPRRQALIATVIAAFLVMSAAFTAGPTPALGATSLSATCGAKVRTSPSTGATVRVTIPAGTKVVANAIVTGGRWTISCGKSVTSTRWYRITSIGGRTVKARYGVAYLYAAVSLFRSTVAPAPSPTPTPITMVPACSGVNIRTGTSTGTTIHARLTARSTVTVVARVSGSSWSATCPTAKSGSSWYRISAVNGRSVSSQYGVTYLYGATGTLETAPPATPTPEPTPTPTPEPTPTPTPEPTPIPTLEPTPTPWPTPSPTPAWIEGIDVSHWQETINWPMVAAAGKRFAFIKASDGWITTDGTMFVDTMYPANRFEARAAGLVVGAYHFARPDATPGDAIAEADHFVNFASPAGGDLLPVLDLETTGGLTTTPLQAWVRDFMNRVYERTGIRGAIYVSPAFWTKYLGDTATLAMEGYPVLWIAHWTTAWEPWTPAANWAGQGWAFWQYTSDGSVPGITGRVDLNRYRYTDFTPVLAPPTQ